MRIKTKLIILCSSMALVGVLGAAIIGYSAWSASDKIAAAGNDGIHLIEVATTIEEQFDELLRGVGEVSDMVQILNYDQIASNHQRLAEELRFNLANLAKFAQSPEMQAAIADMAERVNTFDERARILLGLTESNAVPSLESLSRAAGEVEASVSAIRALAARDASEISGKLKADLVTSVIVEGAFVALLFAVALVLALFTVLRVTRNLRGLGDAMRALTAGELEIEITGRGRADEIGEMAESVAVFQTALKERAELENRVAEEQAKQARAATLAAFQRSLAETVDTAVGGDFTTRVDLNGLDPDLAEFGARVNALIASVETGIGATSKALKSLSTGNLTDGMEGEFTGAFSDLQSDANTTIENLLNLMRDIVEATNNVDVVAANISSVGADLHTTSQAQAGALETTNDRTSTIASAFAANKDELSDAIRHSETAAQQTSRGSETVQEAILAVKKIEESSGKISDIISVIDAIAFQTNLLALNAAVEAARAGESGRGFAVVASEVRTLAQRSADAANDIKGLIKDSAAVVQEGVELVEHTGQSFTEISSSMEGLTSAIDRVSQSSVSQEQAVEAVVSALVQVDEMASSNSIAAGKTTDLTGSLVTNVARLRSALGAFEVPRRKAEAQGKSAA